MSGQKENLLLRLPEVVAEVRVPEFSFAWLGRQGVKVFGANLRRLLRTLLLTRRPLTRISSHACYMLHVTSYFPPTSTNHDHGAHSQRASRRHSSRRLILQRWCISNASSPFRTATNNQSLQHHRRPQADIQRRRPGQSRGICPA